MSRRSRKSQNGIDGATSSADDASNIVADAGNDGSSDNGAGEAVGATVDLSTVTASTADGETDGQPRAKRKYTKRGTGDAKAKAIPVNVTGVEKLLVGIHGGLAMLSGRLEWMLDTNEKIFDGLTEAEFLAKSIKDVAAHYGAGMFDQKTLDWASLTQCLLIVYGGRLFAIRSTPRAPKPKPAPTVQEAARTHNPMPPQSVHQSSNGAGVVNIAGVGAVEFPDSDPRSPNYKPTFN